MLGLLNTVLSKGNTLLTYVKDGLVMANRFLTPPKLTFPVDASAEFNGTSDYIQLNEPFSYTNHTIAAWVYLDSTASALTFFDNRDAANDGVRLLYSSSNIYYQVNSTNLTGSYSTAGEWIFVVGTNDGNDSYLFIDGSQVATNSANNNISVTANANIGKSTFENFYMDGNLANVAIWNRALSSDEINSVMWKSYEGLEGAESNGLQAWYSLDDISSPAASLANMEQLATDKNATIENKAAITAAINALS